MPAAEPEIEYTFTVFTGTRNRAHTLRRPFDSLKAQTFRDFEWVVVDNGSTDPTAELIEEFRQEADFPIRYLCQEDRGKHASMNRAVLAAKGRFFLTLDSDDGCIPTALGRFVQRWNEIPEADRPGFSGVSSLCMDQDGNLIGTSFPADPTDSDSREIRYRAKVKGEKWGFQRTDVMRMHLFPETPGYAGLIPPSRIWSEIARNYRTRYINEVLHIYWQDQADALSRPASRISDAYGGMLESEAVLSHDMAYFEDAPMEFIIKAIKYVRSSLHSGRGVVAQWRGLSSRSGRALWLAVLPTGWLIYRLERLGFANEIHAIRLRFG